MKTLAYLCLQATREGQASYAHVHEIIAGLERRGWQVELFQPSYVDATGEVGMWRKLVAFIGTQLRLMRAASAVDAIYIRWHPLAWPTAVWARLRGRPTVQEVNGPDEDLFLSYPWTRVVGRLFRLMGRLSLRLAEAIVVVTPQLKTWCEARLGPEARIFVIPNGANTALFTPSATPAIELRQPYAIFFGALSPWQGITTLLAAKQASEWPQGVDLVVVGDGPERAHVEAAAEAGEVVHVGALPYTQIPGVVAGSLAGLAPKNNLGDRTGTGLFPLKLFETMACGTPIVVSDFPGQADLVRELGCGLVVPPEDPTALARAVRYLHDHPEERQAMGRRGRQAVVAEHSWDCRARATDEVLSSLLASPHPERRS